MILNFLFLITLILPINAIDIELTVLIPANQRECFHQVLDQGKLLEIEYEVLLGGDDDINFWFYSPTNRVLQTDFKKRDGHQTITLEESGEYQFCFDNSISRFNQKQVYFSLRYLNEHGISITDPEREPWMDAMDKDELGELQSKVSDIRNTFQKIWDNMETAQRYQSLFRNYESHDRFLLENNLNRINTWSLVNSSLMIIVTIVQVVTIRALFETKSAYGKLLRGKKH